MWYFLPFIQRRRLLWQLHVLSAYLDYMKCLPFFSAAGVSPDIWWAATGLIEVPTPCAPGAGAIGLATDFVTAWNISHNSMYSCSSRYMIVLGFNDRSTLVGHFVSSPREREKGDRTDSRWEEQDLSPDRIAHRKSRFDLVAQRQIFRPITETKTRSWELMLLIKSLDKYLWPQQVWTESIKR